MDEKTKDASKAKGGLARAAKLPEERRKEIAKKAAQARWGEGLPVAEYSGVLQIQDLAFPCSVLTDGTRILTQHDFMQGMGMYYSGWVAKKRREEEGAADIPLFLAFENLKPFINKHLGDLQSITVKYRTKHGQIAHGIKADIISRILDVWLDADEAGSLGARQKVIAAKARDLMRALARTAIDALIDEATGYQDVRRKDELQRILAAYISPSLLPWTQRFPMDFYEEMFRLWEWDWDPIRYKHKGPQGPRFAGKLTRQLVHDHLPPGVLDELERRNPPNKKWQRRHKMFQDLSEGIGNPHLEKQVAVITALLKAAPTKDAFWVIYHRVFPDKPDQLELDFQDTVSSGLPSEPERQS